MKTILLLLSLCCYSNGMRIFEPELSVLNKDFDQDSIVTTAEASTSTTTTEASPPREGQGSKTESSTTPTEPTLEPTSEPTTRRTTAATTTTKSANPFTAPPDVPLVPVNQIPPLPQGSLSGLPIPFRGFDVSQVVSKTTSDFSRVLSDLMRTLAELSTQLTRIAITPTRIISGSPQKGHF